MKDLIEAYEQQHNDTELYNLDNTMAKFLLPLLKRYSEHDNGMPEGVMEKILASFKFAASEEYVDLEGQKYHQEGLDLFAEYYFSFWL